jgi:RNA polymerase sigma factor (sigma-70 family)
MSPTLPPRPLRVQSDARLVELARRGEAPAFEALVRRYRKPLLGYCRRLRMGDAQAEDALQQGLLQAWRALRRGDEVSDVKSWLYRIVHNAALDALRRPGRDNVALDESLHSRAALSAGGEVDRRLAVHDTLTGLAALPDMQREALVRTAVHGDSHEQVASALGLSHAAVRGLVHRARVAMRTAATALVPSRAIQWAVRSGLVASAGGPDTAAAGGGSAGMLGALAKGTAILATGGILATGLVATHGHRAHAHHARTAASHMAVVVTRPPVTNAERPTAASASPSGGSAGPPRAGTERISRALRHATSPRRAISQTRFAPSARANRPASAIPQGHGQAIAPDLVEPGGHSRRAGTPPLRRHDQGEGRESEDTQAGPAQNLEVSSENHGHDSSSSQDGSSAARHSDEAGEDGSEVAKRSDGGGGAGAERSGGGSGSRGSGSQGGSDSQGSSSEGS